MQRHGLKAARAKAFEATEKLRGSLRREMPRVAVAAGVCFFLRGVVVNRSFYQESWLGALFGFITFLLVAATLGYYGYITLRWLKRKLLWRVRRRLIITYLFVGLTPIVLLSGLGFLFGFSMALNSMVDTVMKEVNATERDTLANARTLADALAALPPEAVNNEARLQSWLDERNELLQASLPGARIAIWRAAGTDGAQTQTLERPTPSLDLSQPAQFVSEPTGERVRAIGDAQTPAGAPLPEWLHNRAEWSALTIIPSADPKAYASPSLRALVRRETVATRRPLAFLLVVPVSRALVEQVRESTGIDVRPAFSNRLFATTREPERGVKINATVQEPGRGVQVNVELDEEAGTAGVAGAEDRREQRNEARTPRRETDQLGDERTGENHAWVVMPATNWSDGERNRHVTYVFPSSLTAARRHALERGYLGQEIRLNNVLLIFGVIFIVFELLALLAAGWMTRAVTGTVHKLHGATQFIKRGDFSHRVKVRSHDQLGELAGAFNEMSANVETLLQERVKHERLEREVEIAAEVQAQLFPREVPRLETVEIVGECRAARGVAGDYYDYVEIVPGVVAVALGDVAGKGISASLVMSNLQASLRAQVSILAERWQHSGAVSTAAIMSAGAVADAALPTGIEKPDHLTSMSAECAVKKMAASLNGQLCRSTDSNRFATFFLALYDDRTRRLCYTNAGHNEPLLVRADGSLEKLSAGGTVLGAFEWARYEEAATTLAPGDLLVIFSDGLSEAQNTLGEEYGEDRLAQFAIAHRQSAADELRRALFQEIDHWSEGQERGDDQTVVIVKSRES